MLSPRREHPKEKVTLHPRNRHRERYDFRVLIESCPELGQFVRPNQYGDDSIDFFNPEAVKALNKSLLTHYYEIENWDIPTGYLCPPIPGRADYIHHIADLLGTGNLGKIPTGENIKVLDIGVGANCVYPIIGIKEYAWSFVGADIDPVALESVRKIISSNLILSQRVELRLQVNPKNIFEGIIKNDDRFDLTICNPPFHASPAVAQSGTLRKLHNLNVRNSGIPILNFGGQNGELWCEGGEIRFVKDMIYQSKHFSELCFWFSTLISKESNLKQVISLLKRVEATDVITIPMGQGNKISRVVAWTFLAKSAQKNWVKEKWS